WEGRKYRGDRVSMYTGSDNVGSFHQRVHRQLKERWSGNRPYHCYVNPDNPSEAVLYRDLRIGLLAFHLVFGTVFGGFGILLIWGVVSMAGRSARRSKHADQPWLVRKDWARGVMGASRLGFAVVTLIVAVVWG
ncbi:MAG TPA: DUF3592 domain-containing protein, partial [Candidatus Hydrogenedentes bacterium]|nr:DUF3592 domain-containing protein [Candidatus Hydrogenedentota bacterium]